MGIFLKPIADGIKRTVGIIVDVFKSLGNVDMGGLDTFSERVKVRFEPFTKLGDLVSNAFSKIADGVKKVAPIFSKLASIISKAFSKIQDSITKGLETMNFDSTFDLINGGLFAAILLGVKKFIDSLSDVVKKRKRSFRWNNRNSRWCKGKLKSISK